jgi:hypothetical protein
MLDNVKKAKQSKTFCIYPWVHQYIEPTGGVKACCMFRGSVGSLRENTLKEIWNNDINKQMRLDMLNGKTIAGCEKCDEREGIVETERTRINDDMFNNTKLNHDMVESTLPDGSLPDHKLTFIDARFNNLCNLKCRTCGTKFSTSWYDDQKKINKNPNEKMTLEFPGKTENQLFEEIMPHVPNLQRIYFAGGEPLMQIEHYKILEELIRIGHTGSAERPLRIIYNTNFTNLKLGKYSALDMWNHFDNILIMASIDGSYAKAEYWRKNTNWAKVVQNRKDMKSKCHKVNFTIAYTLSWVNAFNAADLHKEWVMEGLIHVNEFSLNLLDTPYVYSLKTIPNWKKKKIEEKFLNHIKWLKNKNDPFTDRSVHEFETAINFMYSKETGDAFEYAFEFNENTKLLDTIRNENFFETFPEHLDMKDILG